MGTHSLIIMRVKREDGIYDVYCVLYHQYDGYFCGGIGQRLLEFLNDMKLTCGIEYNLILLHKIGSCMIQSSISRDLNQKNANGAGDLFAQIIVHLKIGSLHDPILCNKIKLYKKRSEIVTLSCTMSHLR